MDNRPTPARAMAREVATLAWPAILQGLFHTVVFFTDRLILGRYGDAAIASMQISGPLLWSAFSVIGAFGAGIVAVVGRCVGAGDHARARLTVRAALIWAAVAGVVLAAVGLAASDTIVGVMGAGANDTVRGMSRAYMRVMFLAAPFDLMGVAAMTALQASGDTRTPLRVSVVAGALNLVVSWMLVFGRLGAPEWGVAGSAVGSALAFGVHAGLLVWALRVGSGPVSLRGPRPPGSMMAAMRPVLRISLPSFGEKLIFHTGFLVFASLVAGLGEVAMAANQALIAVESLGFIAAGGFGVAGGALVAQRLGAGRPADARAMGWWSAALGAGTLGLVSLLFLLLPELLVGFFSDDPAIVALGARCLRVAAIAQPLMAMADALAGSLRGAGDTRRPLWVALLGPVAVRLTTCWLLAVHLELGLLGIWIGTTLDWAVRTALLAAMWAGGRWERVKVEGLAG
jgi:putative MATE family efflux protein